MKYGRSTTEGTQKEMSNYGTMCGYGDAIEWVKGLQLSSPKQAEMRDRVVERMRYEKVKADPVKPILYDDKRGHRYSYHVCGHCGRALMVTDNYCPNCGFKAGWDSTRCLTGR